MTDSEAILDLLKMARGERPGSLVSSEAEEVLTVALALVVELTVANDRIDRLERLVAEMRGEDVGTLRAGPRSAAAAAYCQEATDALTMRALRVFFDGRRAMPRSAHG